ncbi:MAG TPA: His/Gly/Thr/Pro-type tRNA ligase C-terminal domain-containing protein [Planctomycetota bacterium]|nr:His/Gly/Thr/Pro-type tRNA ligase C-terminal domain-containing protein [Planctomycetota bacterium]
MASERDLDALADREADALAREWLLAALAERIPSRAIRASGALDSPYPCFFVEIEGGDVIAQDLVDLESAIVRERARAPHRACEVELRSPPLIRRKEDGGHATRILGIAGFDRARFALRAAALDRAEERDHRQILFERGPFVALDRERDAVVWLPRGKRAREIIERFVENASRAHGFEPVETIGRDGRTHADRVFAATARGARDLPFRLIETIDVERAARDASEPWEGGLGGSVDLRATPRVRSFELTSYCEAQALRQELETILRFAVALHAAFDLEIAAELPAIPELASLAEPIAQRMGLPVLRSSPREGGGFESRLLTKSIYGRFAHEAGRIRIECPHPELSAKAREGKNERRDVPVAAIRATLPTSLEALFAAILERTGGLLPPWLAPEQARIVTVSSEARARAEEITAELRSSGIRATCDARPTKRMTKERDATRQGVPFVVAFGPEEIPSDTLSWIAPADADDGADDGHDKGRTTIAAFAERVLRASRPPAIDRDRRSE